MAAKKQVNQLVVKSNKLTEARYRLTVQEQRIILTMISMIEPEDEDFKRYRFTIKQFMEIVGISGENYYTEIKKITETLRDKGFTIKEPDGDLQIGWVSSAKYRDQESVVDLRFDPDLKPYLLELKKEFTRYQLKNVVQLRSIYSVRLYELLKQYQIVGERKFELVELRAMLGVGEGKYKLYGDFKRYVLETAKKELPQKTDLRFDYEPIKTGRKVTAIHFDIYSNAFPKKQDKKDKDQLPQDLLGYIRPSQRENQDVIQTAMDYYKSYGMEYVQDNLIYADQKATKDYAGFFARACQENWGLGSTKQTTEKVKEEGRRKKAEEDRQRQLREKAEEERREKLMQERRRKLVQFVQEQYPIAYEKLTRMVDGEVPKTMKHGRKTTVKLRMESMIEEFIVQENIIPPRF